MPQFFQHTDDGALMHRGTRYLAMRVDVLMGAVAALDEPCRNLFLSSLKQAAHVNGGRSLQGYARQGDGEGQALLRQTAATAQSLGWGKWRFQHPKPKAGVLISLTVEGSPFAAAGAGHAEGCCAAIEGILLALGGLLFDQPVQAREVRCKGQGHDHCRFELTAGT